MTTTARSTSPRRASRSALAVPVVLAAILAACSARNVQVRHFTLGERVPLEASARLSRVHAVMRLPEPASPLVGGDQKVWKSAARLLKQKAESADRVEKALEREDAQRLLESLSTALKTPYSGTAGYQVASGKAAPALLDRLSPSALLWLEPSTLRAARSVRTVEEEKKSKKGGVESVEKVTKRVTGFAALFSMGWRLESWPDGTVLARGEYPAELKADYDGEKDLAAWVSSSEDGLTARWIADLTRDLLPHPVMRARTIHKGRSAGMKAAFEAHGKGDLEAARAGWSADPGWEAQANLGVLLEKKGDFAGAAERYKAALGLAAKPRDRAELERYLADLGRAAALPQEIETQRVPWFESSIAVLPFSNQSIDAEAPDTLRKLVAGRLERGGYKVAPLAELDQRLRDAGVSLGEHLAALTPARTAEAAQARLLLYGDVDEFNMVNAGIYRRKLVRVRLRLADADGNELWRGSGEGFEEEASSLADAGKGLVGGLGEKLIGRAFRTFLQEESSAAVVHATESLPALPAAAKK